MLNNPHEDNQFLLLFLMKKEITAAIINTVNTTVTM